MIEQKFPGTGLDGPSPFCQLALSSGMKEEIAIRLAAWFDGEVSPGECAEIEHLLEADPEARAYVDQLARTRSALEGAHLRPGVGSAAWGELRQRLEHESARRSSSTLRFPRMLAAAAAVVLVGMFLWLPLRKMGYSPSGQQPGLESVVQMVETDLEGATPIVYIDQPSGWTVVWVLEAEG